MGTLLDTSIQQVALTTMIDQTDAGRQLRVLARILRCVELTYEAGRIWQIRTDSGNHLLMAIELDHRPTFRDALAHLDRTDAILNNLPLRIGSSYPERRTNTLAELSSYQSPNAEVPVALQDLANEIAIDIDEAVTAAFTPQSYYPGVDDGIEPVPDDHVTLVCTAMTRELQREGLRRQYAWPVLTELPFTIQRALVERRRLRFLQWGIDHSAWERGTWSVWNIREDPDWTPRIPRVSWG